MMNAENYDLMSSMEKEALLTFNLQKFKHYFEVVWPRRGWTNGEKYSNEVYRVLMRQMVIDMPKAPDLKKTVARKWLNDNGYGDKL